MKRLLFVYVENSCCSQIAEAFALIHGGSETEVYGARFASTGQSQSESNRNDARA